MSWLSHNLLDIIGGIVTISSVLANFIPSHTIAGKVVHFLAVNLRGLLTSDENKNGTGTINP